MDLVKTTTPFGRLDKGLTQDAQPIRMPRSVGKGKGGNGNSLPPNKGNYGLGLGEEPVRMSRSVGKGPGGSGFKLAHQGPARMPRSHKGSASHDATTYGVGGVAGKSNTTYGV